MTGPQRIRLPAGFELQQVLWAIFEMGRRAGKASKRPNADVERHELEAKNQMSKLTSRLERDSCRFCGGDHFSVILMRAGDAYYWTSDQTIASIHEDKFKHVAIGAACKPPAGWAEDWPR